ncbi:YbaN family protein [Pirellulaceae bacterium SH449]
MFTGVGVLFVAVGFVGVFLPGIPTTGPLIVASYFLTRSNPRLQQRLFGSKVFRNYTCYLDGSTPMPLRARISALVCMWVSIFVSCFVMKSASNIGPIFLTTIVFLGMLGSVMILFYRRGV